MALPDEPMNVPSIRHRPGLYVRLSHACPRCDGPHVQRLPPVSVHREHEWYECEDCQHLWALRYSPTKPANRWDAR
jgi:hypothetical protein